MIRIAIAEDHDLVRKGIVNLLLGVENFQVLGEFSNGKELLSALKSNTFDVIILDIEMPEINGIEVLKILTEKYPKSHALMLTMHQSEAYITQLMSLGAKGYLPKNCNIEELIEAINSIYTKGLYMNNQVSQVLLANLTKKQNAVDSTENESELTEREKEIVVLMCEGKNNKEIAEALYVSIRTVEVHRNNISKKINTSNVQGVIKYALKNGIYTYNG